ncbi:MAG: oligosaccharide flippase family protein, partial [Anaerolineae bacterium]|nr:oligosaccharide flippase family protein [Anaerolineae bacterium]
MQLRRLLSHGAIYGLGSVVVRAITWLSLPVYLRLLSKAEYGIYDYIVLLGTFASTLLGFQIYEGLARLWSEMNSNEERRSLFSTAWWFTLLCCTVFCTVIAIFHVPIGNLLFHGNGPPAITMLAGAIFIATNALYYLLQVALRFDDKPALFVANAITASLSGFALGLFALMVLNAGVAGLLLGQAGGLCAGLLLALLSMRKHLRFGFDGKIFGEAMNYAGPMIAVGLLAALLLGAPRLIVKGAVPIETYASFAAAIRLAALPTFALTALKMGLYPLIYKHQNETGTARQMSRVLTILMFPILCLVMLVGLFAENIVPLVLSAKYIDATPYLLPLTLCTVLLNINLFNPAFQIVKRTRLMMYFYMTFSVLMLASCYAALRVSGILATSWTACCVAFLFAGAWFALSHRHYPVPFDWRRIGFAAG